MAKTGRRHAIISGVTIGTCCACPTLWMLQDGYKACVTTFALACELQASWKLPTANDMLAPFNHNLSEYGFVLQNFRNNANQHAVPDPFGMVK